MSRLEHGTMFVGSSMSNIVFKEEIVNVNTILG